MDFRFSLYSFRSAILKMRGPDSPTGQRVWCPGLVGRCQLREEMRGDTALVRGSGGQ